MKPILFILLALFCMGARNPFEPPFFPPTASPAAEALPYHYRLSQLTLKAVLWGTQKAVALFETDDGKNFMVKVGSKIGKSGGKVTKIGDKMVTVTGPFGRKIFRIRGSS